MNHTQIEQVTLMRQQGASCALIASTIGVSVNTIKSYCRQNKVERTPETMSDDPARCRNCGAELQLLPKHKPKKFCSDNCRMSWWNAHPELLRHKSVTECKCRRFRYVGGVLPPFGERSLTTSVFQAAAAGRRKIDAKAPKSKRSFDLECRATERRSENAMLHSLSAQVSYYSDLIQKHTDWQYAGVYADEAVTGTKDNRPEFDRLINDCRNGKVDYILTKSISRFARNTVTLLSTVRELRDAGIGIYFEEQRIDTLTVEGEFLLTILASYAQEESRSVSENCKWRARKGFEKGKPYTCEMLGYRLVDGKITVIPEEAEIVRRIFAMYLDGYGMVTISKKLNAEGITSHRGKAFNHSSIWSILRNEKHCGDLMLQKFFNKDHISKRKTKATPRNPFPKSAKQI